MNANQSAFPILLLIGRPAAGKSEVIDFLKRTPVEERIRRFHIQDFEEIDDFPMLWTWFEEDRILESLGHPRLHTDMDDSFKYSFLWDVLIRRICLEYGKRLRDAPAYHQHTTAILEFARGSQHGGFQRAFEHLSRDVIRNLAVLYIRVSWEESLRKNRARFNPERPDSILEHGLTDQKMAFLYKESDWDTITSGDPDFITMQGTRVPYAVLENEDDVTTGRGEALGSRLEETLGSLWDRFKLNAK